VPQLLAERSSKESRHAPPAVAMQVAEIISRSLLGLQAANGGTA
jgi:hypothetical protein